MQPQLVRDLQTFTRRNGRIPSPDEVYGIANFREPGGIGRLTEALSWLSLAFVPTTPPPPAPPPVALAPKPAPRPKPAPKPAGRQIPRGARVENLGDGVQVIRPKPITESLLKHVKAQMAKGLDMDECAELFEIPLSSLERALGATA